jgi:hypothetical protein
MPFMSAGSARALAAAQAPSDLEARLYKFLKADCVTVDYDQYAPVSELIEELACTADELTPILEQGKEQGRLARGWDAGEPLYSLITPKWLAAKAESAGRANDALDDEFGFTKGKGKSKSRTAHEPKPKPEGEWSYAQVPRAVFRDPDLSLAERMAACALADAWNVNGKRNPARIIKASYETLAEKMATDKRTAIRAIAKLERHGWITITRGKGHGSNRYRFTSKAKGVVLIDL